MVDYWGPNDISTVYRQKNSESLGLINVKTIREFDRQLSERGKMDGLWKFFALGKDQTIRGPPGSEIWPSCGNLRNLEPPESQKRTNHVGMKSTEWWAKHGVVLQLIQNICKLWYERVRLSVNRWKLGERRRKSWKAIFQLMHNLLFLGWEQSFFLNLSYWTCTCAKATWKRQFFSKTIRINYPNFWKFRR